METGLTFRILRCTSFFLHHSGSTLADEQSINTTEIDGQGFSDPNGEPIPLPLKANERGEVSFQDIIKVNLYADPFSSLRIATRKSCKS
jgi:hypothetical protein